MYKNAYQAGKLSIFYSVGQKPLLTWKCHAKAGMVRRLTDEDIQSVVLDMQGSSVATTYITCPPDQKKSLGIYLPVFVILFKNMNKYFNFEVEVSGPTGFRRHFRASNFNKTTSIKQNYTTIPLQLHPGWNTVVFDLHRLMKYCYNERLSEVHRVKVNANCRLRRVYFADRLYKDEELTDDYKVKMKNV